MERTDHQPAEESRRESEACFRQLAEALPHLVWAAQPDGTVDYFNQQWRQFTDSSAGDTGPADWRTVLHPDDASRCLAGWSEAVQSGNPFDAECRLARGEGGGFGWFLARAVPVRDAQGAIVRWHGTFTDIDAQKRAEQRSVRLNQTLVAMLAALPDIVFVTGADGRIEFRNPAAAEFARAVALGDRLPEPIRAELEPVLQTGGEHLPTSLQRVHRFEIDREERHFLSRIVGMKTPEDRLFGAVVMLQDVTQFRLLDEVKTNVISTVGHELRGPITGIRTALLLLLEQTAGALNGKQIEMLSLARDETERLLRTLENLLDLTRFEEHAAGMRLEHVAPRELVLAAIEETRAASASARVAVRLELPEPFPALKVDRERIIHVLTNLLTNAIKYSPEGAEVVVRAQPDESHGVRFSVRDRGPGVPPAYQSRIFEKFFRVPGTEMKGAGLGLSIAREFVRAHRGRIGVHSHPGEGSEFYFTLPGADL